MYAALWRSLPGPLWVRILSVTLIVLAVLSALMFLVFPWVNTFVNTQEVTVEQ